MWGRERKKKRERRKKWGKKTPQNSSWRNKQKHNSAAWAVGSERIKEINEKWSNI